MTEEEHKREVRRAWAIMAGFDPDELEAAIDRRAAEIKRDMERAIFDATPGEAAG